MLLVKGKQHMKRKHTKGPWTEYDMPKQTHNIHDLNLITKFINERIEAFRKSVLPAETTWIVVTELETILIYIDAVEKSP